MAIDGRIIKAARESRNRSQAFLADILKVDQTYISKIEKNRLQGGIKGDELLRLAKELQYDPFVFLGEIPMDDGDLQKHPRLDELQELKRAVLKLETKVSPPRTSRDEELCSRILANQPLRDLVELVQLWEAGALRRFTDMAYAYLVGSRDQMDRASEPPARRAKTAG